MLTVSCRECISVLNGLTGFGTLARYFGKNPIMRHPGLNEMVNSTFCKPYLNHSAQKVYCV